MKKLAITIPTYNGESTIERTICAFLEAMEKCVDDVELIISDNCSTDNTESICKRYALIYPNKIFYYRNEYNKGYDYNVKMCVEKATAEYVWLFSDNEIIKNKDVVIKVVEILENYDVEFLFLNHANEIELQNRGVKIYDEPDEFFKETKFKSGLISSCILKRSTWIELDMDRYIGSEWIHFAYQIEALSPKRISHMGGAIYEVLFESMPSMIKWGKGGTSLITGLKLEEIFLKLLELGYNKDTIMAAINVIKGGYPQNIIMARVQGLTIDKSLYERMNVIYGRFFSFRTIDSFFLKCPKEICFFLWFWIKIATKLKRIVCDFCE